MNNRDNSGALFRNKSKKRDTQPDYQGEVRVGGHDYYISGWLRESANGVKFLGLAFKGKASPPPYRAPQSAYKGREPGSDDDKGEEPPA